MSAKTAPDGTGVVGRTAPGRLLVLISIVLYAITALSYGAIATGILAMGNLPGEEPVGSSYIGFGFFGALICGIAGCWRFVFAEEDGRLLGAALLAPMAAAVALSGFYRFDSYYLPTLRRMSDGGMLTGTWIAVIVAIGVVTGILTLLHRRLGAILTPLVLLLCAFTTAVEGLGH